MQQAAGWAVNDRNTNSPSVVMSADKSKPLKFNGGHTTGRWVRRHVCMCVEGCCGFFGTSVGCNCNRNKVMQYPFLWVRQKVTVWVGSSHLALALWPKSPVLSTSNHGVSIYLMLLSIIIGNVSWTVSHISFARLDADFFYNLCIRFLPSVCQ